MKKHQPPAIPAGLACGLLEDSNRALFLMRKNMQGVETIEFPCVLLNKGDNPVAALTAAFHAQTGIDAQVHEVKFEKRYNFGSKKRKAWIPVLVFKVTAKRASVRASSEFSGYKWLEEKELRNYRMAKTLQWL